MNQIIKKDEVRGMLTAEQVKALTDTKNIGEGMMHVAQEYSLIVEEVLMKHFGFSENDLKKFHKEVEHILAVTREAEGMGLDAVGLRTIRMLAEIAEIRKARADQEATKILLPKASKEQIINKLLK